MLEHILNLPNSCNKENIDYILHIIDSYFNDVRHIPHLESCLIHSLSNYSLRMYYIQGGRHYLKIFEDNEISTFHQ